MIYGTVVQEYYVTSEEVQSICRSSYSLEETKSKNLMDLYMDWIINNAELGADIGLYVRKCGDDIGEIIKKEGLSPKTIQKIQFRFNDLWQDIGHSFQTTKMFDDNKKFAGMDRNLLINAFTLTCLTALVTTIEIIVLAALFGDVVGTNIAVVVCAPINEETCKQIAIKGGFLKEFLVVFNTYEFSSYVAQYASVTGLGKIVLARTLAVGMHLTTSLVQWLSNNKNIQQMLGIEKDPDKQKKLSIMGKTIGTLLHGLWNGIAVLV